MSKTFSAWKIDDPQLLRWKPNWVHAVRGSEKVQPTLQVRELQWGLRLGMFADNAGPSTSAGIGRNVGATHARHRRIRIQLAVAAGIVLAASAFGLHQYKVWPGKSPGPQLQAWAQPGLATLQLEADVRLQLATQQLEADAPSQLSLLTRERHARNWQRLRVKFPKADAQLGPAEPETRLAPAESPISTSTGSIPVSNPVFDPPLTAAPGQNPTSIELPRDAEMATYSDHAIDQGGAPISANNPQPQPQRDRSARRHMDRRQQGLIANMLKNINDVLYGAWGSAPPRRAQVGSRSK